MQDRPNIVLIITDQQRFDTIAALGYEYAQTPHLDQLVAEGVTFSNCFVNAPACGPARCSLFGGRWPHTSGMLRNGDPWQETWVPNIARAGYHTANVGKMHFTPFDAAGQFDYRFNVENKQRFRQWRAYRDEWDEALADRGMTKYQREDLEKRPDFWIALGAFAWEKDPDMHPDNFLGRAACEWVANYEQGNPFFLTVGFPGPHPPYDPTPDWLECYKDTEFPLTPLRFSERDQHPQLLRDMAQHNAEVAHDSIKFVPFPAEAHRQRQRRFYMANISLIDAQIGAIRQSLADRGLLDDTVIIFTSDHGDTLTDHFCSQKWTMYDSVRRVPAIVWAPGRFSGGRKVEALTQWFDLGATILEIAGADFPEAYEASSLITALEGGEFPGREYVFSEHGREEVVGLGCDFVSMVRSRDWKLVHLLGHSDGQLFDLRNDPEELINLWADPDHRSIRAELTETLGTFLVESIYRTSHRADGRR